MPNPSTRNQKMIICDMTMCLPLLVMGIVSLEPTANIIHDNCMNVIGGLHQDVIIIDPPWGGLGYKNQGNLQLSLGGYGIDFIANYVKHLGIVFLKLPLNADLTNIPIENKFLINNKKNTPSFYLVQVSQGLLYEHFSSELPKGWSC